MECVKPRRKNSPLNYFCLHFGWPQTNSKLGNLLFDSTSFNAFWHSFAVPLWWLQVEYVKPRRKNSPLDYFCLRFGWPQTNSKLGNLLFDSTSPNAFWHSFAVPLCGGFKWNRTTDTRIFSPLLYQLSYEAL